MTKVPLLQNDKMSKREKPRRYKDINNEYIYCHTLSQTITSCHCYHVFSNTSKSFFKNQRESKKMLKKALSHKAESCHTISQTITGCHCYHVFFNTSKSFSQKSKKFKNKYCITSYRKIIYHQFLEIIQTTKVTRNKHKRLR